MYYFILTRVLYNMNKTIKAFSIVTIISALTRFISFVFKIYLSRVLGAEGMGLYQITISIISLLIAIAASGIPTTISRNVAENTCLNKIDTEREYFTSSLIVSMFLVSIPSSILLIFPNILNLVFQDDRCINLFFLMLPLVLTTALYSIFRAYLWGKKRFFSFSITELIDEVIKVLFALILFSFPILNIDKFYSYTIAMIISDVITLSIIFVLFKKNGGKFAKPLYIPESLKCSTPITLSRVSSSLLSSFLSITIPMLLTSQFTLSTQEATAEFGRASGMVMPLIFAPATILGSLGVVLIPEASALFAKNNIKTLENKFNKTFLFSSLIISLFTLLYLSFGNEIGLILYKDKKIGMYLFIALYIMMPQGINGIFVSMLNSIKKENKTFLSYTISAAFLILIVYLTPKYIGIYSYFISLMVFNFVSMVLNYIFLRKNMKIKLINFVVAISSYLTSIILGLFIKQLVGIIL